MQRLSMKAGLRPAAAVPGLSPLRPLISASSSLFPSRIATSMPSFHLPPALHLQRYAGYTTAEEPAAAAAAPAEGEPAAPQGKKDKKKKDKKKKAETAAVEEVAQTAGGQKLHVKRKLCRQLPSKRVWTVVGEGRLLEFRFQNDDLLGHPTFVTPYPYGDEDEDQDEVNEAFAAMKAAGKSRRSD